MAVGDKIKNAAPAGFTGPSAVLADLASPEHADTRALLLQHPGPAVMVARAGFAAEVARAGYATDPSYTKVVHSVMRQLERSGWK